MEIDALTRCVTGLFTPVSSGSVEGPQRCEVYREKQRISAWAAAGGVVSAVKYLVQSGVQVSSWYTQGGGEV